MHKSPISAYLTTWNSRSSGHPIEAAIHSLLEFCSEVVIVDGGSRDGTWEQLCFLAHRDDRIRLISSPIDTSAPHWALELDLTLKSHARAACKGKFCWQADADEIICADDARKVHYCLDYLGSDTPLVALPLLEYWGSTKWVRRDQYPATPKLSINDPRIVHGIPSGFRAHDAHGLLYALPYASLAASYIWADSYEPVPSWSLLSEEIEALREVHDTEHEYEAAFYDQIDDLPVTHNFSWVSIEHRLFQLRDYWSHFHKSYYRLEGPVSAWPFFDKDWCDVEDLEIAFRAADLEQKGPGVISGETEFPTLMEAQKEIPLVVHDWLAELGRGHAFVLPSQMGEAADAASGARPAGELTRELAPSGSSDARR